MAEAAQLFLSSFNRIEKWLQQKNPTDQNLGFSQLVRILSDNPHLPVKKYEADLLQISQLRNAIVHDQIGDDFIIAEPNEWIVNRILTIEKELAEPETVLPRFKKPVTGFEIDLSVKELLKIVADKRYSQFPLYNKGQFKGLLTLRVLGYWFATHFEDITPDLEHIKVEDLLAVEGKKSNYRFVSRDATIDFVQQLFKEHRTLEAILITEHGEPDGNLEGIIRPRDVLDL
ncbi:MULTISPECIES: CBS domain-containing protein [Enterococcus]|uniref:CBS domain-containing protein n=1 Tax=Enterococcus sulfureus ATCC 49903 TaxID=1140003 RepID=S0L7Z4_9ENTE|nr:CBS domain-containing protein [Enterococcus sulfureus]EOT47631.1 hypothetical protein OMY_01005 [Enterococcus sulfureus ATCC 49903]EOT83948.1 hypothetical protein I573_01673 [Enterococcus sulfureus ATCC 49903]